MKRDVLDSSNFCAVIIGVIAIIHAATGAWPSALASGLFNAKYLMVVF